MNAPSRRGRRHRRSRGATVSGWERKAAERILPDVSATHPAMLGLLLLLGAAVVALVTLRIQDTNLWALLAQGRAYWNGLPPTVNEWTWPTFGQPQVAASWGFSWLIWPLWDAAGVTGIFVWKWFSALSVFALLWFTARRMGARGALAFAVLAVCAVIYRDRSDARPESLAAMLLAATLLILEAWRSGGRDFTRLLIPIALVWVNVHISVHLLFAVALIYLLDAHTRRAGGPRPGPLWITTGIALLVTLVNPSGWRTLWQPFDFFFNWRFDPMFMAIEELNPFSWTDRWERGLQIMVILWPVLLFWRAISRRQLDLAELLICATFTALALSSLRFAGSYVIVAGPFVARDLGYVINDMGLPARGSMREMMMSPFVRAAAAAAFIVAFAGWHVAQAGNLVGVGIDMRRVPKEAADFMDRNGIRGRGFNHMQIGGYLSHRFWPDSSRAPFVTTQPELSPAATRGNYLEALRRPAIWYALDGNLQFEYVLLERHQDPGDHLLDVLDSDTTWTMVFADDAAEIYLRRSGIFHDVVARHGYSVIPGGRDARLAIMTAVERDSLLRVAAIAEAERMVETSPWNGYAHRLLAYFALMDERYDDAEAHFQETLRQQPGVARVRELLGFLAMRAGRPQEALRYYEDERDTFGPSAAVEQGILEAREGGTPEGAASP